MKIEKWGGGRPLLGPAKKKYIYICVGLQLFIKEHLHDFDYKWSKTAAKRGKMEIFKLSNILKLDYALQGSFRLNVLNYKRKYLI